MATDLVNDSNQLAVFEGARNLQPYVDQILTAPTMPSEI